MNPPPQRLDLEFHIKWAGRWHIGSGQAGALADRQIRRRRGLPFVPGSQIKGVLRHHCERLAAALGCPVVSPHQVGSAAGDLLDGFTPLRQSPLLIDRLFGTRYQGDCLFVDDAMPLTGQPEQVARLHSRTSIDRVSGTARQKTLFVTEVADAQGPPLLGRIRARHPAGVLTCADDGFPCEYALLLAGLVSLDGFGADRSTGLGRCQVTVAPNDLRWSGGSITLEQALEAGNFGEPDWASAWIDFLREVQAT